MDVVKYFKSLNCKYRKENKTILFQLPANISANQLQKDIFYIFEIECVINNSEKNFQYRLFIDKLSIPKLLLLRRIVIFKDKVQKNELNRDLQLIIRDAYMVDEKKDRLYFDRESD